MSTTGAAAAPQDGENPRMEQLLKEAGEGVPGAMGRLIEAVYPDLRRLAGAYMARERPNHTLQPSALVNELYMRMAVKKGNAWAGRSHFFAAAAMHMRRILVDSARSKRAGKRGKGEAVSLPPDLPAAGGPDAVNVLVLDEALTRLAELHERQARLVELRYFGGLSLEEAAAVLGIAERTAKRDWAMAKAWLHSVLSNPPKAGK